MVLRYKLLVACVITLFAIVWMKGAEFFPVSATTMYSQAAVGSIYDYFLIRDGQGAQIKVPAQFFVAPSQSGSFIAEQDCFSGLTQACHDFFRLVAQWVQQPVTVEAWRWNYKTGERTQIESVTITP